MLPTDRRRRLRAYLKGGECIRPASVFDPVSSRIAFALGLDVGMLGGSIASAVILGAPDVAVMTLTELADQVRRITRASDISQIVDADHGYGNALNAMRTVRELEGAGASGVTIEDTALPSRYGSGGKEELIPIGEMTDKLRAAVEGRQDPATVIFGRSHALQATTLDDAAERVAAYAETGVDAIFLMGVREEDHLRTLRAATSLPFMLGSTPEALGNDLLAGYGVRFVLRGHGTFTQSVRAVYESLEHQARGLAASELAEREPEPFMTATATASARHEAWRKAFLGG